jgi:hypothetical protein
MYDHKSYHRAIADVIPDVSNTIACSDNRCCYSQVMEEFSDELKRGFLAKMRTPFDDENS